MARWFLRIIIGLFIASSVFGIWYYNKYDMGIAQAYSVNTPEATHDLLIITQGSHYKNEVVTKVVDHFAARDVFIQVYDVSELPFLNSVEWDAVLILHTWEIGRPPKEVRSLIEDNTSTSNIVFFTTSGNGEAFIKGLDGMSGASILNEVDFKSREAIRMINELMSPISSAQ